MLGCSGDTSGAAPITAPSDLYWSLQLNYRAVNLALVAPYDTVRLSAAALDANGHVITNAGPVTLTAADSTVTVDPTGLVRAHYQTPSVSNPTYVAASVTVKGVTHTDTAWVQVLPAVPVPSPLATFSIQPAVGDSAKVAYNFQGNAENKIVTAIAADNSGNVLRDANTNNLLVSFVSGDKSIATIDRLSGEVLTTSQIGHVTFYASTYAYGVVARDSLLFTIGYPISRNANLILTCWSKSPGGVLSVKHFYPDTITIGVGGKVFFSNGCFSSAFDPLVPDTLDIVFDDATVVPGGMLSILKEDGAGFFAVQQEGIFHYHSAKYGGSGTIISSSGP